MRKLVAILVLIAAALPAGAGHAIQSGPGVQIGQFEAFAYLPGFCDVHYSAAGYICPAPSSGAVADPEGIDLSEMTNSPCQGVMVPPLGTNWPNGTFGCVVENGNASPVRLVVSGGCASWTATFQDTQLFTVSSSVAITFYPINGSPGRPVTFGGFEGTIASSGPPVVGGGVNNWPVHVTLKGWNGSHSLTLQLDGTAQASSVCAPNQPGEVAWGITAAGTGGFAGV